MQEGSVVREQRKLGPDVWCYRWWESGPSGNRVHRRIVLGTAEQLRDISSARQMTTGLIREINASDIRLAGSSMTLAQLADHFQQRELVRSNGRIAHSTKKAYQGYLRKWIVPRWGNYLLPNIKAVEVELWLKHLERAAGTCCKIRNVMSVLFNHARRYDLYDRNPIQWVRQSAKRRSSPDVLTSDEVRQLLRRWSRGSESWSCWMWQRDCDRANFSLSSGRTSISAINNSGSLARSCSRSWGTAKRRLHKNPCRFTII